MVSKQQVTISDIAQRADVSISTVSRVLRGTARVSQAKREAVLEAVEALDYKPNLFASGLASGQSMAIGVVTQNFGSPFYDAILQGVTSGLDGTDYSPIFADGQWQPAFEKRALEALMQRQVDGLIMIGGLTPAAELCRHAAEVPFLLVGRRVTGLEHRCLCIDNFQAACEATNHLLGLGHRRIAFLGGVDSHDDASARKKGYLHALQQAGIHPIEALIVEGDFRRQTGLFLAQKLLQGNESFTAVFAANDQMAFGARMALFRSGIRVPDDISLVGFDDEPAAAYMIPPLTTIRQPGVSMGQSAADCMIKLIQGQEIELPILETKLILRESTALLR